MIKYTYLDLFTLFPNKGVEFKGRTFYDFRMHNTNVCYYMELIKKERTKNEK